MAPFWLTTPAMMRDIAVAPRSVLGSGHVRDAALYRALMDHAHEAIGIAGPDGIIVDANRALEQLLGLGAGELVGRHFSDFCPPEEHAAYRAIYDSAMASGVARRHRLRLLDGDGRTLPVDASLSRAIVDGVPMVLAIFTDGSAREHVERQLRQAQKVDAIGKLAAGVAHDFNNMLSVILSSCDLMLQSLPPGDPRHEDALDARTAAERAVVLTRQLTSLGRKELDSPRLVCVNQAIGDVGRLIERVMGESICHVRLLQPEAGSVRIDPAQLEQLLLNLAINARDAMPGGGTLTIATAAVQKGGRFFVRLTVGDDGHGLEERERERLFESFFSTKESALGLGLATVQGIVAGNGGHIEVESAAGAGSRFIVYLPRVAEEGTAAGGEPHPPGRGHAPTVLVVDDDPLVGNAIRRMLRRNGHEVLLARSAEDAATVVRCHPGAIDVVLVDVVLRGVSGEEAARTLSQLRPQLEVIFMSGFVEHPYLQPAMADGRRRFLPKPFTQEALLGVVTAALGAASAS
jgi:two-component system cell cycle sensor histidine kinase/response regulator CckA